VPDVGSADETVSMFSNLTVTVSLDETNAKNVQLLGTDPLGTPRLTTSPDVAPVTVIVKSEL